MKAKIAAAILWTITCLALGYLKLQAENLEKQVEILTDQNGHENHKGWMEGYDMGFKECEALRGA